MRSLRLALTGATVAVLFATSAPVAPQSEAATTAPSSPAPSASQLDALRAERAALAQQLSQANDGAAGARAAVLAAEQQLSDVQTRLATAQATLRDLNGKLADLSTRIAADETNLSAMRKELGGLLRAEYVSNGGADQFTGALVGATSFGDVIDRVRAAQHVTSRVADLQSQVTDTEATLVHARSDLEQQFTQAQGIEGQLNDEQGRLIQAVADRDLAVQQLQGPTRTLAGRLAAVDDQISAITTPAPQQAAGPVATASTAPAAATPTVAPPSGGGIPGVVSPPCGNRFAFGNCTYYVATRRCIPWLGNAYEWYSAAAADGFLVGQTPYRSAVVVWGRGGSSPVGHVAYVEAVGPAGGLAPGTFLISEMNFNGFDRINQRVIRVGAPGIIGFIYGHS